MAIKIFRSFFILILTLGLMAVPAPQAVHAAGPWYVATTGDDNNDCLSPGTACATINGAIGKASAGDTVNVAVGTYTGTDSEVVLINKDIILSGGWDETFTTQSGVSTIDGQASRRGITITSGVNTTVDAYLIQNGFEEFEAGGILNQGMLTLSNSGVNNNQGSFFAVGGISNDGSLNLSNTVITGNQGTIGGIENSGTLTLNDTTVGNNTTTFGGSAPVGGISNISGGGVTISDSIISLNIGVALFNEGSTMTLNNTTVSENSGPGTAAGGIVNSVGTVILNGSTVSNNSDRGIANLFNSTMTLNYSIVRDNTSSNRGSGIQNDFNSALFLNHSFVINNATDLLFQGGGGIYNGEGSITLDHSTISDNSATEGSGILNSSRGIIIVSNSTIRGNSASDSGGGIKNDGTMQIDNVTISMNTAVNRGGGIDNNGGSIMLNNSTVSNNTTNSNGGGIHTAGFGALFTLNNSTVSGNSATNSGGGIYNFDLNPSTMALQNTILSKNIASSGPDCSGAIDSFGYNIIEDSSGCAFASTSSDLAYIDPLLGMLQDNGGPSFTHALLTGSPAIDAGNPAGCTDQDGNLLTTDQRGVARPQGAACDIGAFELEFANPIIEVSIDIKPGSEANPINTRSKGTIPVAVLSTADFDAPSMVDTTSLTFGKVGDEASLVFCNDDAEDINEDGLTDLVCHFYTQSTGFQIGDSEGIFMGQTVDDILIEGHDPLNILK